MRVVAQALLNPCILVKMIISTATLSVKCLIYKPIHDNLTMTTINDDDVSDCLVVADNTAILEDISNILGLERNKQ